MAKLGNQISLEPKKEANFHNFMDGKSEIVYLTYYFILKPVCLGFACIPKMQQIYFQIIENKLMSLCLKKIEGGRGRPR